MQPIYRSLHEEVLFLQDRKCEGTYWDFKREWYGADHKSDLLHDIICMANNLADRDAYIIIGIDEKKKYRMRNVSRDPGRKDTAKLIDFLRDKKFAGGIRPEVYVEPLTFGKKKIDVIVIKNSRNTPYYLSDRCESVCANSIYTRVGDTNTPIDKSADINNVEYLWRKRFNLDISPYEQLYGFLEEKENWIRDPSSDTKYYYKYHPEFTFEDEPDEYAHGYEFFSFGQMNRQTSFGNITAKYLQTALVQCRYVCLDSGRCQAVAPSWDFISFSASHLNSSSCSFRYYLKDSMEYRLNQHYYKGQNGDEIFAYRRFMECVLEFENENQKESFKEYVKIHRDLFESINISDHQMPFFDSIEGYNMEAIKQEYHDALVLKIMLEQWPDKQNYI